MSDRRGGFATRTMVGLFWLAVSSGALVVAELIAILALARLLSPEAFGLYAAALMVVRIAQSFLGFGLSAAIVQRQVLEERHVRTGFTLSLLLCATAAALLWVGAPAIAQLLRLDELAQVIRVACIVPLFQGAASVAGSLAHRELSFKWLAVVDSSSFVCGFVIAGPLLAWFGFGVWALVGAYGSQHFVRATLLLIGQPHAKRPMLDLRTGAELLNYGGGWMLGHTFNYLADHSHKLVVGRFLGAEALGVFTLATQLTSTAAVVLGKTLDRVLFPSMSLVQDEKPRLCRAYRGSIAACALVMLPGSILLAIVADELVLVTLGDAWQKVTTPLQILAFGMPFRASFAVSNAVVRASGAVYRQAWRQSVFAAATLLGAFVGQFWGLAGVAFGLLAAGLVNFLLMTELSLRMTGVRWTDFVALHLPSMALAGVIGTSAWAVADRLRELDVPPLALLLEVTAVAGLEALVLCWLLPALFLGPEGRSVLRVVGTSAPGWLRRRFAR